MSLVLTIILAVLVAGVSLGAAWVSGHAKEYYVQHPPKSKVLSQVVFWFSVLGLTATLFLILLPLLAAFVNLEMDIGSYLEVGPFIAGLWPLYLVILALLVPTTLALAFSLRPPKPVLTAAEQQAQGIPAARYRHYPRSNLIFIPMMSHRRRAYQYHSSMAAAGRAGQMSGGMGSAAGGMSGGMGASSYAGGMAGGMGRSGAAGGMSGGMAASSYAGGMSGGMGSGAAGGMSGGMATSSYAGGMSGGMSGGSSSGMSGGMGGSSKKSSSSSSSNRSSMNGNAALLMLVAAAIAGGYFSAKAVRGMGGKRQAEINRIWKTEEAQRVIHEYEQEQAAKLAAKFADLPKH